MAHPRTRRLALATCAAYPSLFEHERELVPMLRARGVDAHAVVWNEPAVDWRSFGAVVVRSTWDYFERLDEFLAWLSRLEDDGVAVHNRPALMRWNSNKLYLRDLERRGIRIIPTVFCERGSPVARLDTILAEQGWEQVVVKPAVSGGAFRTHRADTRSAASLQAEMEDLVASCGALVQPFFPEVQEEGEWSLFFFGGELSHVVRKLPAAGDYRAHPQFEGVITRADPPRHLEAQAREVLAALPEPPLYARVDGLRRGGDLHLMEAELIEPQLFLAAAPDAAETFVRALERVV